MAFRTRRVEYFCATVRDEPGAAQHILSRLAGVGVALLAFTAVPIGRHGPSEVRERPSIRSCLSVARRAGALPESPLAAGVDHR
jgi:hypothetical protein